MKKALLVGSVLGSLLVPQIAVGQEAEAEQQYVADLRDSAKMLESQRKTPTPSPQKPSTSPRGKKPQR